MQHSSSLQRVETEVVYFKKCVSLTHTRYVTAESENMVSCVSEYDRPNPKSFIIEFIATFHRFLQVAN